MVTTSVTVEVCVKVPLVSVTVSVYEPAGVVGLVVTDIVDEVVAGLGLKLPVAPAGRPLTLRLIGPLKPATGVNVKL